MRTRPLLAAATFAALTLWGGLALASEPVECNPSRAMIVLDRSSSMVTGWIGGQTKWDVARDAIHSVAGAFQEDVELGLAVYPASGGECSVGEVVVSPRQGQAAEILAALGEPPPANGFFTPTAETLEKLADDASLSDASYRRFAILITDGWQWCYPYEDSMRLKPVDAVEKLRAKGIKTYVVGFGNEADPMALNLMAQKGGTALVGCDPSNNDISSPNPCYYHAEDSAGLVQALNAIAGKVQSCECEPGEVQACSTSGGMCQDGEQTCGADRAWGACEPAEGATCGQEDGGCSCRVGHGGSAPTGSRLVGGIGLVASALLMLLRRRRVG